MAELCDEEEEWIQENCHGEASQTVYNRFLQFFNDIAATIAVGMCGVGRVVGYRGLEQRSARSQTGIYGVLIVEWSSQHKILEYATGDGVRHGCPI